MSKFDETNTEGNILSELLELKNKVRELELRKALSTPAGAAAEAFPVGSIFISVVSTNPNTLLGYGTWTAFGSGRTLVGLDAGQTEFDTVEETGGAKTHTLSTSEIPAHKHNQIFSGIYYTAGGNALAVSTYLGGASAVDSAQMQDTGGDGAHNNLQPYIVVYMWKRTG